MENGQRLKWWDQYESHIPIVVGHYWCNFNKREKSMIFLLINNFIRLVEVNFKICVLKMNFVDILKGGILT
uniref:hypothetical protein n=1 Tax=Acinetobacter bereziniae TaxID=106648 RepID=UPI001C078764